MTRSDPFPISDEAQAFIETASVLAEPYREEIGRLTARAVAAEAALQRVREVIDERAHTTVGAVKADVCAALGVGVPTETDAGE